jgi:hypothetical protein
MTRVDAPDLSQWGLCAGASETCHILRGETILYKDNADKYYEATANASNLVCDGKIIGGDATNTIAQLCYKKLYPTLPKNYVEATSGNHWLSLPQDGDAFYGPDGGPFFRAPVNASEGSKCSKEFYDDPTPENKNVHNCYQYYSMKEYPKYGIAAEDGHFLTVPKGEIMLYGNGLGKTDTSPGFVQVVGNGQEVMCDPTIASNVDPAPYFKKYCWKQAEALPAGYYPVVRESESFIAPGGSVYFGLREGGTGYFRLPFEKGTHVVCDKRTFSDPEFVEGSLGGVSANEYACFFDLPCTSNETCSTVGGACIDQHCELCPGTQIPNNDSNSTGCVDCNESRDCNNPDSIICKENKCVYCELGIDNNGECIVSCANGDTCPKGTTCQNGACLPPPPKSSSSDTVVIVLVVLAVIVVLALIAAAIKYRAKIEMPTSAFPIPLSIT